MAARFKKRSAEAAQGLRGPGAREVVLTISLQRRHQHGNSEPDPQGWTVGIGDEYAFTNFVSGFVEYDYYNVGDRDVLFTGNTFSTFTYDIKETKSVVKVGLNLRWGGSQY
jgi:hypothetical protein